MTEVLQSSPSHFPSPSSSSSAPCAPTHYNNINNNNNRVQQEEEEEEEEEESCGGERKQRDRGEGDQLSVLELLVTAFRKSLVGCSIGKELCSMEIGVPTNVRHVAHVTFDRFNGFLGLPVEFEPEVPRTPPSASATVFGVSTESMQLSFDSRGNSVPTILLLMQRHLYARGGLQAEGIFRINGGNNQEEYIRDQLNRGVIPDGIDVHSLAGLIKAWFRELPTGILDSLPPEEVMQSQSEEACARLVRGLPPMEAALLDWAINLMADVAQFEHFNKMNARNIAMVFAPNMTQMSDPLTALMYAVQVMNFLKTLIVKTLKEREDNIIESAPHSPPEPSDENDHQSYSRTNHDETKDDYGNKNDKEEDLFVSEEPTFGSPSPPSLCNSTTKCETTTAPVGNWSLMDNCPCKVVSQVSCSLTNGHHEGGAPSRGFRTGVSARTRNTLASNLSLGKGSKKKLDECPPVWVAAPAEKSRGPGILSRINSRTELFEAWR